ncbi:MAG: peptidase M14, partial [Chloroflexi bacterium]|nr:peptidase M14 [Chloroflexota bacterium]
MSQDIGHLAGRDERTAPWSPWMREWTTTQRPVEWLVRAPSAGQIRVTASAQRAGLHRHEADLA